MLHCKGIDDIATMSTMGALEDLKELELTYSAIQSMKSYRV
ncbi:hypothetical protein NST74_15595 [Paenibacillus sp. FSL F4-0125]